MEVLINSGISVWGVVKLAVLFALFLYIIFTIVVVKQVRLMTETLNVDFDRIVSALATAHLIFAFAVFLLALFVL